MEEIHHGYRYDWKFHGNNIILIDKHTGTKIERKIRMNETALGITLKGKWVSMQRIHETHKKVY